MKVQKLTWVEMDKCQIKGLCYICDDKYFLGNRCKKQESFITIFKDVFDEYIEVSPQTTLPPTDDISPPYDPP
jgi:hypothetical protein